MILLATQYSKVVKLRDPDSQSPRIRILTTVISRELVCFFSLLFYFFGQQNFLLTNLKTAQLFITIFFTMIPIIIFFQERVGVNEVMYSDDFQQLVNSDLEKISSLTRDSSTIALKQKYISNINSNFQNIKDQMILFAHEYFNNCLNSQAQLEMEIFIDFVQKLLNKYCMVPGSQLNNLYAAVQTISIQQLNSNITWINLQSNLQNFAQQKLIGLYEISVLQDQIDSLSNILGTDYYNQLNTLLSNIKNPQILPAISLPFFADQDSLNSNLTSIVNQIVQNNYKNAILTTVDNSLSLEIDSVSVYATQLSNEIQQSANLLVQRVFYKSDSILQQINNYISSQTYNYSNSTEFNNNIYYDFNLLINAIDNIITNNKNEEIQNEISNLQNNYSSQLASLNASAQQSSTAIKYPALSLLSDEANLQNTLRSIYNNLSQSNNILSSTSVLINNLTNSSNALNTNSNTIQSLYNNMSSISFPSYTLDDKSILRQLTRNMYTNPNYLGNFFITKNTFTGIYDALYKTVDNTSEIYLKTTNAFPSSAQALYSTYNNSFNNLYLFQPILFQNDIVDENFNSLTSNPLSTSVDNSFNVSTYQNGFLLENVINIGYPTSFCIRAVTGNPKIFFYTKKNGIISNLYFFNSDIIFSSPNVIYTHSDFYNYLQTTVSGSTSQTSKIFKTNFQIASSNLVNVQTVQWPIQQIKFYSFPYFNANRTLLIDNQISCSATLGGYNLVLMIYFSDKVSALSIIVNKSNAQYNFWKLQNGTWSSN